MPFVVHVGPLQMAVCDNEEAAGLLGVRWTSVGKWVGEGLLASVAVPLPWNAQSSIRYALYQDVCWLAAAMQCYTVWDAEEILYCRRRGALPNASPSE